MELLSIFLDIVLHLDTYLEILTRQYGVWIYGILFVIIFCETGLVVFPFLPGDSLLFVAGAVSAVGDMNLPTLIFVLSVAAVSGNVVNYHVGRFLGPRVFHWPDHPLFNRAALEKTHAFYQRHGGKTLIVSRFLPLLRTFAPFVAGIGSMNYPRFFLFNLTGGLSWVVSLTLAGYFFGNLPWVRQNLSAVVVGIIVVSLLPALITYLRNRANPRGQ